MTQARRRRRTPRDLEAIPVNIVWHGAEGIPIVYAGQLCSSSQPISKRFWLVP